MATLNVEDIKVDVPAISPELLQYLLMTFLVDIEKKFQDYIKAIVLEVFAEQAGGLEELGERISKVILDGLANAAPVIVNSTVVQDLSDRR